MRTALYSTVIALTAFGISLGLLSLNRPEATETPMIMAMESAEMDMSDGMDHAHPMRDVAYDAPTPAVTHLVFPDAMDGYNIQILTENFTFAPASINGAVAENEGHAHLYVNGEKISRIYGNWVHLPSSALVSGANVVGITLNANDHSEWSVEGVPVASTVIVYKP